MKNVHSIKTIEVGELHTIRSGRHLKDFGKICRNDTRMTNLSTEKIIIETTANKIAGGQQDQNKQGTERTILLLYTIERRGYSKTG